MAGKQLRTMEDLLSFINDVISGNDEYAMKREQIKRLTNTYVDGKNRARCFDLIDKHLRNIFG